MIAKNQVKIENVTLSDLRPFGGNPRKISDEDMVKLRRSIRDFGFIDPVIARKSDNLVIGGHQRVQAAKLEGMDTAPVVYVEFDDAKASLLNIALNKISGEWDWPKLGDLFQELDDGEVDLAVSGFDEWEVEELLNGLDMASGSLPERYKKDGWVEGSLTSRYLVPPLSVLDARQGYWLERKRHWNEKINDRGQARGDADLTAGSPVMDASRACPVSVLDPVVAEICLRWFSPGEGARVFDCFAGDTAFGFVAASLGFQFSGTELRQEQVDFNRKMCRRNGLSVNYICDDGQNIEKHLKPGSQDFFFSCPPYFDLEVYSDKPNDASNQEDFPSFMKIVDNALSRSMECLAENRFAAILCSEVRDKRQGNSYGGFLSAIKESMAKAGMLFYNDMVLIDPIGTSGLRVKNHMRNRKVVRVHQNLLVFYKGDMTKIQDNFPIITDETFDNEGEDME